MEISGWIKIIDLAQSRIFSRTRKPNNLLTAGYRSVSNSQALKT